LSKMPIFHVDLALRCSARRGTMVLANTSGASPSGAIPLRCDRRLCSTRKASTSKSSSRSRRGVSWLCSGTRMASGASSSRPTTTRRYRSRGATCSKSRRGSVRWSCRAGGASTRGNSRRSRSTSSLLWQQKGSGRPTKPIEEVKSRSSSGTPRGKLMYRCEKRHVSGCTCGKSSTSTRGNSGRSRT